MALRMRRRRRTADLIHQGIEEGRERASELASRTREGVEELARDVTEPLRKPRRARRAAVAVLALLLLAGVAGALYAWWRRRREDEEFATLLRAPDRPGTSPAPAPAPEAPAPPIEAVVSSASSPPEPEFAAQTPPWTPSATPAPAVAPLLPQESPIEPLQRPAWNSHRGDVPLFVLPPRPSVPFRASMAPQTARARLPGTARAFLH